MSAIAEPIIESGSRCHLQWSAIIAGAVAAASVSFTLHAFAAAVGLSVISAAPTWRDSSAWLWLVTGLYFLFASLAAFGVGGYIAGRLRAPLNLASSELEFRDGISGLIAWAAAVVLAAILAVGIAAMSVAPVEGKFGATESIVGENIIAADVDELLRSDRVPTDISYRRTELTRVLLKTASHDGVTNDDRRYLTVIVANATGLSLEEASSRLDRVIGQATRDLHRARVAAVLQAFFVGAALLVGAAAAWFSAVEGGRDREENEFPGWHRSHRRTTRHRVV